MTVSSRCASSGSNLGSTARFRSGGQIPRDAEPNPFRPLVGALVVARGSPQFGGVIRPRAAPRGSGGAIAGENRRAVRRRGGGGRVPAILGPLPHIAEHIVKPERIRGSVVDRNRFEQCGGLGAPVIGAPGIIDGQLWLDRAEPERRVGAFEGPAAARGELPLGFTEEAIRLAGFAF